MHKLKVNLYSTIQNKNTKEEKAIIIKGTPPYVPDFFQIFPCGAPPLKPQKPVINFKRSHQFSRRAYTKL